MSARERESDREREKEEEGETMLFDRERIAFWERGDRVWLGEGVAGIPVSSLVGALPTIAEGEADELDMAAAGASSFFPASSR